MQRYQSNPEAEAAVASAYLPELQALLPQAEWQILRVGIWLHCSVANSRTPDSGWKLHLSVVPRQARELLGAVVPILRELRCRFKCAASESNLKRLNGKNWWRGGGGKFMTVYPDSPETFVIVGAALDAASRGFSGPYVLSDRRYLDNPVLSYRYGGFKKFEQADVTGEVHAVIPAPDGSWYRDDRLPYYQPPPWTADPLGLSHPTPEGPVLRGGRFVVKSAIAFKNSGGVYCAVDTTTEQIVIIKEARRNVHISDPDLDAQMLLRKEARLLRELSGLDVAPAPIDFFKEWENIFLAQELIAGLNLWRYASLSSLALQGRVPVAAWRRHFETMFEVFRNMARALQTLHECGIAFGDLSPGNVIVGDDRRVRLIDFEAACQRGVDEPPQMGTPGFAPPAQEPWGSIERDLYAFGALMLQCFVPSVGVSARDPSFVSRAVKRFREKIPAPRGFTDLIIQMTGPSDGRTSAREACKRLESLSSTPLARRRPSTAPDPTRFLGQLVAFVLAQLDTSRHDRLAPADRKVYASHPLTLAYGAGGIVGVLKAVSPTNISIEVLEWLRRTASEVTHPKCGPGYLAGMSGIAACLLSVGLVDEAKATLGRASLHPLLRSRAGLFHGLAGFGCVQLYFHQILGRDSTHLGAALETAETLLQNGERGERGMYWYEEDYVPIGLGHGGSGVALFFLYLFAATGDRAFLRHGMAALDFDLACAETLPDNTMSWRARVGGPATYFPYYEMGSAGIGCVLARYHSVVYDGRYLDILKSIRDVPIHFCVRPGLLTGLAGRGEFLTDLSVWCPEVADRKQMLDVVNGLELFASEEPVGRSMPGDELTKISCDYATGSSGVIGLLHRFQTSEGALYLPDRLLKNVAAVSPPTPCEDLVRI